MSPGPLVGSLLDGRYQVTSTVARGGMATVYQATDTRLEREVALKAMHPFLAEDPEFVRRFTREARAAARISDRNVVSVYDQGTDPRTHAVFLVMELVRGRTLRALLDERGRLTVDEALSVLGPVASALGAAHRTGVVHRDVKPENVLLGDDGRVLVADFGLARAVSASPATANAGLLIGTVAYLAPEQVRDGRADFRSDVYAAGVLLFELLTGRVPYEGDSPLSVAYRHLHEDVPATGIDPRIDALLASVTSRDASLRPVDGAALHARIRTLRSGGSDLMALADALAPARPGGPVATAVMPAATGVAATPTTPSLPAANTGSVTSRMPAPTRPATRVMSAPPPAPTSVAVARGPLFAAALDRPERAAPPRPRRRHGVTLAVVLVLVIVTAAAGAAGWWFGIGRYTSAPALLGLDRSHANETASAQSMRLHMLRGVNSDTIRIGYIAVQAPGPGARILHDGTIAVQLSLGPVMHHVPLVGAKATVADATADIVAAGLKAGPQRSENSSTVPAGDVLRTDPAAGTSLVHGAPVGLVLSAGPPPVAVPRLKGALAIAASDALTVAGLKGVVVSMNSDTVATGVVIDQSTPVGTKLARGSTVTYEVSTGPVMVTVPDVRGSDVEDATSALHGAGFTVKVEDLPGGYEASVVAQSPRALSSVPEHGSVTIYAF